MESKWDGHIGQSDLRIHWLSSDDNLCSNLFIETSRLSTPTPLLEEEEVLTPTGHTGSTKTFAVAPCNAVIVR